MSPGSALRSGWLLAALGLLTTACGGVAESTAPHDGVHFASERYGYELELPAGWFVRDQVAGSWTADELNVGSVGSDWFQLDYATRASSQGTDEEVPGITYELYVAAVEKSANTTLEGFTDQIAETMDRASSCHGTPDREATTVDGEPATMLVYDRTDCGHDHHVLIVSVLHGARGYSIVWLAQRGAEDARRADFEVTLDTVRFTD